MSNFGNLLTKQGLENLNQELENLKNIERPKVITDIAEARSHGDLRENSEYAAAKEKQTFIEGRIAELESLIANAEVFDPSAVQNKNEIRFGAKCKLTCKETKEVKNVQIVSPFEADLSKGLIAIDAPVAKILLGRQLGEIVEIFSKGKKHDFLIEKIEY